MEKALILLENELGIKLDIEKDPLSVTAYDLEGNEIGGGGGDNREYPCCLITFKNTKNTQVQIITLPTITDNGIFANDDDIVPFFLNAGLERTLLVPCVNVNGTPTVMNVVQDSTVTTSDLVNCIYTSGTPAYITNTGSGDSSITITIS